MATNDPTRPHPIRQLADSLSDRLGVTLNVSRVASDPEWRDETLLQIGPISEARMLELLEVLDRNVPASEVDKPAHHAPLTALEADCLKRLDAIEGEHYELFARLHEASEHENEYALFSAGDLVDQGIGADDLASMIAKAERLFREAEQQGQPEVTSDGAAPGGKSEPPAVTILAGDLVETIFGIHGIVEALRGPAFSALNEEQQGLIFALSTLATQAKDGLGQTTTAQEHALDGIATVYA
jgi:hypothetical protein